MKTVVVLGAAGRAGDAAARAFVGAGWRVRGVARNEKAAQLAGHRMTIYRKQLDGRWLLFWSLVAGGLQWGAIAAALTGEGARVALAARPSDRLEAAVGRLAGAVAVDTDLSTADGPATAVDRTVEALGGLDLLLVNSGGPPPGTFEELDEAAWTRAIDGTVPSSVRAPRSRTAATLAAESPAARRRSGGVSRMSRARGKRRGE